MGNVHNFFPPERVKVFEYVLKWPRIRFLIRGNPKFDFRNELWNSRQNGRVGALLTSNLTNWLWEMFIIFSPERATVQVLWKIYSKDLEFDSPYRVTLKLTWEIGFEIHTKMVALARYWPVIWQISCGKCSYVFSPEKSSDFEYYALKNLEFDCSYKVPPKLTS